MDFHSGSEVKLIKLRRCEWCGQVIEKGMKAYRGSGKFGGEFYNYRMHLECADAMKDDPYISQDGFSPYENQRPADNRQRVE